jgi:hypothetical protein
MANNHHLLPEAFFELAPDAEPAEDLYVCLYRCDPFYGGPEEGGWWGRDVSLVAYRKCSTSQEAEALRDACLTRAEEMNNQERRAWGDRCLRELEWCEARGLDPDYLGETDGETTFSVVVEKKPGASESRGCRHYE